MRTRPKTSLSPIEESITIALVQWLESALLNSIAEDLEVVSGSDMGEPADPFLAVFVSVAGGRQGVSRALEITLAIMAEDSTYLPDYADEILDAVHDLLSLPIDPKGSEGETGTEPFSALLAEIRDMQADGSIPSFFTITALSEAVEPRLGNHAENNERRIYRGSVIL